MCSQYLEAARWLLVPAAAKQIVPESEEEAVILPAGPMNTGQQAAKAIM